jgi:hypothetical protein
VIAVVALAAAAVVATLAVRARHAPTQAGPSAPAASGPAASGPATRPASAPTDLKLRDSGDTVTLTWADPSGGTVPFFVEAGPAGTQLRIMGQVSPGDTTYLVAGLNPRLDYCFSVVAVYSSTLVAPSDLVCTQRTGRSGASPSR